MKMYLSVFKADSAIFDSSGIVITGKFFAVQIRFSLKMKQFDDCEKLKILLKTNVTYLKLTECFSIIEEYNKARHVCYACFSVKTNQQNLVETWKYLRDIC